MWPPYSRGEVAKSPFRKGEATTFPSRQEEATIVPPPQGEGWGGGGVNKLPIVLIAIRKAPYFFFQVASSLDVQSCRRMVLALGPHFQIWMESVP